MRLTSTVVEPGHARVPCDVGRLAADTAFGNLRQVAGRRRTAGGLGTVVRRGVGDELGAMAARGPAAELEAPAAAGALERELGPAERLRAALVRLQPLHHGAVRRGAVAMRAAARDCIE